MILRNPKIILIFVCVLAGSIYLAYIQYRGFSQQPSRAEAASVDRSVSDLVLSESVEEAESLEESAGYSRLSIEQPEEAQSVSEFLEFLDGTNESERTIAHEAAQKFMNGIPADSYLRWRPLSLDALEIFVDKSIRLSGGPSREPVPYLRFSPFQSLSFVAENTMFEDNGSTASWVGDIVEGGSGKVSIIMAHESVDQAGALIYIVSDHGNFNVAPTGTYPYYVVTESNPHARVKMD